MWLLELLDILISFSAPRQSLGTQPRYSMTVSMAVLCLAGIVIAASADDNGSPDGGVTVLLTLCVVGLGLVCTAILKASLNRGFWPGFAMFGLAFVLFGWVRLGFQGTILPLVGSLPFGYIGGVIGRAFGVERLEE